MAEEFLIHYGTPRHSGRYPWGSGENPYQHESSFLNSYRKYQDQGMSDSEIAKIMGLTTRQFIDTKSYELAQERAANIAYIMKLTDEGYSNVAIGEKLGRSEAWVRYQKKDIVQERVKVTNNVADVLKENVDSKKYIDVGPGTATYLGVSEERVSAAIKKLQDDGYSVYNLRIKQPLDPNKETTIKVLCEPGTSYSDVMNDKENIGFVTDFYSKDGGRTFLGIEPPADLDSSRLMVRYGPDGGKDMDGVIQLRRGVDDISLGGANYAQVRIQVDGTHYIKGMAIYSDDMPPGVDVIFNTNKTKDIPVLGTKKSSILKPLKVDKETGEINKENPFGTTLRMEDGVIVGQRHYIDADGKDRLSPVNIVRQEGDWNEWSKTLSSQFLSKQPVPLIRQQLKKSYDDKKEEFDEINHINQPEIKKSLLLQFAEDCDASASHLKAAALPRQANKVILPLTDIPENEVYAPTFRDGEMLALVRHPHAGPFEMPILKNNTKLYSGKKTIGSAIDAIGINPKTAEILSGADFDGDTVLVIPTINQKIRNQAPLKGLKGFDPKESYKAVPGMKELSKKNQQNEMGRVSNLITDMTIKGASEPELAAAVRHSMVVIDAEKHVLNYKQSEIDNGIAALKTKYQGGPRSGSSTLISRANAETHPYIRKETINKETGEKEYDYENVPNKTYSKKKVYKDGTVNYIQVRRTTTSTQMKETKDAYSLSSGTQKEDIYASYANSLKEMANESRKIALNLPSTNKNTSAEKAYSEEVNSLESKLKKAYENKPKERKAQIIANVTISAQKRSNPDMDKDELKKISTQALIGARQKTGASRTESTINITDKEWEAINSGALSSNKITQILQNANPDRVKELAMPRETKSISDAKITRIKNLNNNGYTPAEIADAVGVSTSTVFNYLKEE